jgi:Na+/H+ antiporter NhaD/arsenite permease-like protein
MHIRIEFILFALILAGVAMFHKKAFYFSVIGFFVILAYKLIFDSSFHFAEHFFGNVNFLEQLADPDKRVGEWGIMLNLFGILLGFSILSKIFEESGIPAIIPRFLPNTWVGPLILLVLTYLLSTFLDNIAAALLGGAIAIVVFRNKVHIGYIAAIVAASNAGGAGSVLGDTTTTMMWIEGVNALVVLRGFVASLIALAVFSVFAARQQFKYQPIQPDPEAAQKKVDWMRIAVVVLILIGAIIANIYYDMPALGVWVVIVLSAFVIRVPWREIGNMMRSSIFLICLVLSASLMPVEELPSASWKSAFFMGLLSSVFDNIPLTKLCLEQGSYDWGLLAYTIGFGGSMIWFGSSAGVAITSKFSEARHMLSWLKNGWHVALAYVVGFTIYMLVLGWHPADTRLHKLDKSTEIQKEIQGYFIHRSSDYRM